MDAKPKSSQSGRHLAPTFSKRTRNVFASLATVFAIVVASAEYTVVAGDTLGAIAADLGVAATDLAAANGIANPDLIRPGQVLVVPGVATGSGTHVVAAGETLGAIASRYGIDVTTLADINGITNLSLIYIGTALRLSGPVTPTLAPSATSSGAVHVVAAGENLAKLAAMYGTSIAELVNANDIDNPNLIRLGQNLTVPGSVDPWICPVENSKFFNDWGFPRSGGRFHVGNDLFAAVGAPVRAPVGGWLEVLTGPVGGLQFRLYGDEGNTYIGSHLDTAIESGPVAAGQQIGTVGTSGNAAGAEPHLHFELLPGDGVAVNPYPTLQAAGC